MTPYFDDGQITIYHADCQAMLKDLDYSAIVSDPPYGIGYQHGKCNGSQATKFYGESSRVIGDDQPFDPTFLLNSKASAFVLWGANNYAPLLPRSSGWLVWDKRAATVTNDHSDCELAWTNLSNTARVFYHMWDGFRRGPETGIDRLHPTQKPVELMSWCLGFVPPELTVCDPFMGSGTTLVAAKRLGRKAIGIEIEERYCEIAVRRLAQAVLPL